MRMDAYLSEPLPAAVGKSERISASACPHTLGSHSIWV